MKERLSSLLDGDVEVAQSRPVFEALRQDDQLRGQWDAYCLIGDALRGEHGHSPGFVARVMAELDNEPTLLAPPARKAPLPSFVGRPAMAVAASAMGVVALGLVAFTMYPRTPDSIPVAGVVAKAPAQPQVEVVQLATTAGDDSHRNYLFVHQAMSGGGPIPGAVHYVRTVSDARGDQR